MDQHPIKVWKEAVSWQVVVHYIQMQLRYLEGAGRILAAQHLSFQLVLTSAEKCASETTNLAGQNSAIGARSSE